MLNHFNMRCVPIKSSSIGECGFTDFEPWHRQKLKSIAYIILVRFCLLSCRQFSVYLPRSLSREIEQCFQLSFDAVLILNNFISLEVHIIRSLLLLLLLLICGIALMKFNIKVDLNEYVLYVFILNHTTHHENNAKSNKHIKSPYEKMCLYESTMHENLESSESQNRRIVCSLCYQIASLLFRHNLIMIMIGSVYVFALAFIFLYLLFARAPTLM